MSVVVKHIVAHRWLIWRKAMLYAAAVFCLSLVSDSGSTAIVGEWMIEKGTARVMIYQKGSVFSGKISWLKDGSPMTDENNPEPSLRKRKLLGLEILSGLKYKGGNSWEEGRIYDPRGGIKADCLLRLIDRENLKVRAYIGTVNFGKSELWKRHH